MAQENKLETNKALEQLLSAFATVAKHTLSTILEALYTWRVQIDATPPASVKEKLEEHIKQTYKKSMHQKQEVEWMNVLTERKEIAADYIFCCAVLLVLKSFHEPELVQQLSGQLEGMCFHAFKRTYM